jgi:hypothetical protein
MKNIVTVILIVMIFCIGCSNSVNKNVKETNTSNVSESQKNSNTSYTDKSTDNISSTKKNDTSQTLNVPRSYIDFIKQQTDYDENDTIVFYAKQDIDMDGIEEIIIASGFPDEEPTASHISQIYILHNNNGEIEQLGDNLKGYGYSVYDIKLINLQNKPKKYIYCGLTNSVNLTGFKIIELINNQPEEICYSASGTGAGDDQIRDFDNDGQFDGYVQNRWSYDVLYYQTNRTYKLFDNDFILDGTYVEIPEYPSSIEEVITQYLSLRALNEEKSQEVSERLSELCSFDKANEFDFSSEPWDSVIRDYITVSDDRLKIDTEENGSEGQVSVTFMFDKKEYKRQFRIIRTEEKWIIDNIE